MEKEIREINKIIRQEMYLKAVTDKTTEILNKMFKAKYSVIYDFTEEYKLRDPFLSEYKNDNLSSSEYNFKDIIALFANNINEEMAYIVVNDISENVLIKDICLPAGVKSFIIVGCYFNNTINGLIGLYFDKMYNLEEASIQTLKDVADNMAIAIALERSKVVREIIASKISSEIKIDKLAKALDNEKKILDMQSDFIATASHEFKTPVAIFVSTFEVLARMYKALLNKVYEPSAIYESEEYKKFEKQEIKFKKNVERIIELIDTTLSVSRFETGKIEFEPKDFNLKYLIEDITKRHQDLNVAAKCSLDLSHIPELFFGDRKLMDQILTNLIGNAIKYASDKTPEINIYSFSDDNTFTIAIKDNGIGIPEEDIEKLFGKFFRAKNSVGTAGTGIGLYLTKSLVQLHDGIIKVESSLNAGSTFFVQFPIKTPGGELVNV